MEIANFIEQLKCDNDTSSHINLDKEKEILYMQKQRYRFQYIMEAIPTSSSPIKVLDIGPTPFTIFLKKELFDSKVWSLDRTDFMSDRLEQVGVLSKICDLDSCHIPFEEDYFDVVIFAEVLEHIFAPPTEILRELKRIIRPGGKLILTVPNIACMSNRLKLLFGRTLLQPGDHQMNKDWIHGHGHIHEYTKAEILSLCRSVDFNIINAERISIPPMDVFCLRKQIGVKLCLYYWIIFFVRPLRASIFVECLK